MSSYRKQMSEFKQFVSLKHAIIFKEMMFDEQCIGWYDRKHLKIELIENSKVREMSGVAAPTYRQAFYWLREKHSLEHAVHPLILGEYKLLIWDTSIKFGDPFLEKTYSNYEDAEQACLSYMLEKVKNDIRIAI